MNILYIGDIMGSPGRSVAAEVLPRVKHDFAPDIIVAQAENVSHGSGMTAVHLHELQALGIDFFTSGNHTLRREALHKVIIDPAQPVNRPANQTAPGPAYKYLATAKGDVLFISLLGYIFPRPLEIENPLKVVDRILEQEASRAKIATIVNFHGDMSSEKRVIGYYLDGRVTAVVGDHWHIPTADAQILPAGTAHITDVGMCGSLHSSLGVSLDVAVRRWRDDEQLSNKMAENRPYQFNAVLIKFDPETALAQSITHIQRILE